MSHNPSNNTCPRTADPTSEACSCKTDSEHREILTKMDEDQLRKIAFFHLSYLKQVEAEMRKRNIRDYYYHTGTHGQQTP